MSESSAISSRVSSGIIGFCPFGVLPGYLQAEIILICFGFFIIWYIIQASVGCFLVPVTCILAMVPGAMPTSFRSGFRQIFNTLFSENPYCRIFIFECLVQEIFPSSGNFKSMLVDFVGDGYGYLDFVLAGFNLRLRRFLTDTHRRCLFQAIIIITRNNAAFTKIADSN